MNNYDDIINLNRPISKHKHLGIDSRSAQFAPFSALVGYDEAVKETARLTDKKIEIDEGLKEMINIKLNYLNDHIKDNYQVIVTYFIKDKKKNGGKDINKTGIIKRIDSVNEIIKFSDNSIIKMNDIINISSDIFNSFFEK